MTTDKQLAPTDAELAALAVEINRTDWDDAMDALICFARAVLARWGQPAHSGEPLTPREIELIDGMIAVQLDHAMRCDTIANRAMADKQKGWDMERVALLQKFKAAHGIKGGQHGTE